MRSLSLAPGSSSDCVSYAGFPGSAAAGMRLSESSNVAAPGRCAHHPGITPGGVICGDRDSPMNRGVRVASPRVPASTLISHRRGGVRGSSCAATSSARFARQRFHDRVLSAMAPGSFSRRTVSQRPATPGPARPCHRQPPAMPLSTRSSAPGLPWGSQSGAKGNGHARTKEIAARIRVPGATQRTGNMPKGSVEPGNLRACRGGLSGRTCLLRSDETAPPGDLGRCTSGSRRRRIHPAAGDR